jgi:hypothetical protein
MERDSCRNKTPLSLSLMYRTLFVPDSKRALRRMRRLAGLQGEIRQC